MKTKKIRIGSPIVFKKTRGKYRWLIIRSSEESEWELPKNSARTGESSVRASIRMMGEQGGMDVEILEEAGRATATTKVNNRSVPTNYYFYLAAAGNDSGEPIGFAKTSWLEYAQAVRKLPAKRDRNMLKAANETLKQLKKEEKFPAAIK